MPKLKRYLMKVEIHPIEEVVCEKEKENIQLTVKAIKGLLCAIVSPWAVAIGRNTLLR
ncbi:hypothetical protein FHS15_003862 [Paenibacillus castaneae]|nr:hypothetical protein [Paenibacillus castaneae]NIK78716.1 hypothetical protein [Paenibacillus castaneae]